MSTAGHEPEDMADGNQPRKEVRSSSVSSTGTA
eukprot:COSAG01_NODE_44411_length_419_cov_1.581250_2_plen_32_part_01